jgi:two-component system sensor histidine kinase DesK
LTDVDQYAGPAGPAGAEWIADQRKWTQGWRRLAWSAAPLLYLVYVAGAVAQNSRGREAVCGYAILAAFGLCILVAPVVLQQAASRRFWTVYAILVALFVAELPFARAAAFVMCLYITMITVARLGGRSVPVVLALTLAALLVPLRIPSWHVSLADSIRDFTPLAIPIVAMVTFAVLQVMRGNLALAEARAELARLAAENERIRIARDLHDLLGHSLTTITVKASLARRLGAADPGQALQEIADVEAIARQSLADVRAAVAGYRDVTLTGEIAAGRELLRAAGITADLPRAVDVVDPAHHELFGWAVREGLTNVVRHSRATSCTVRLSGCSVEIVDDGVGGTGRPGNGLSGLRERVAAAGGVVDAGPLEPGGWRLRVSLSPAGGA